MCLRVHNATPLGGNLPLENAVTCLYRHLFSVSIWLITTIILNRSEPLSDLTPPVCLHTFFLGYCNKLLIGLPASNLTTCQAILYITAKTNFQNELSSKAFKGSQSQNSHRLKAEALQSVPNLLFQKFTHITPCDPG